MTLFSKSSQSRLKMITAKGRSIIAAGVIATAIGLGAISSLVFLPSPVHAQSSEEIAPETIEKIENYLAGITTLKADFVQISSDGGAAEGKLFMERPGKMRFEYNPPAQILLVATGHDFIYYDKEINAPTYLDIDETPAGIILAENISLTDKVKIVDYRRTAETIRVELVRKSDPGAGSVTLVFSEKPMQLRQWNVTDPTGIETTVTLFNAKEGMSLDPELFKFERIWPKRGS